jgi:hypothetical protein
MDSCLYIYLFGLMMKMLLVFFTFIFASVLWACPNCGGSALKTENVKTYIITIFVLLTYVPLFLIFKLAFSQGKKSTTKANNC